MTSLVVAASYVGDLDDVLRLAWQAGQIRDIPAAAARRCGYMQARLPAEAGNLAAAEPTCAATLARARDVGDLYIRTELLIVAADLDLRAAPTGDIAAHLHEAVQIALHIGTWRTILDVLYFCGYLCAATGRYADAISAWAIDDTLGRHGGFAWRDPERRRRQDDLREAQRALGPDRARAAEQRGAVMSLATAAEYALTLTAPRRRGGHRRLRLPHPHRPRPAPHPVQRAARIPQRRSPGPPERTRNRQHHRERLAGG